MQRQFSDPGSLILPCCVALLELEQKHANLVGGKPTSLVLHAKVVPSAERVDLFSTSIQKCWHVNAISIAEPDFEPRCCEMGAEPSSKKGDNHRTDGADGGASLSGPCPPELPPCRLRHRPLPREISTQFSTQLYKTDHNRPIRSWRKSERKCPIYRPFRTRHNGTGRPTLFLSFSGTLITSTMAL